jgi:hypothetical protein
MGTRTKNPLADITHNIVRAAWVDFCQCQRLSDAFLSELWGISETRVRNVRTGHQTTLAQWQIDVLPDDIRQLWEARRRTYQVDIDAARAAGER